MNVESVKTKLQELNKEPKKKFNQSIDLVFLFKNLDLKKPTNHIDFYAEIPHTRGRKIKVCALVSGELAEDAKKVCDLVIQDSEFSNYKDKKKGKILARQYDYFIGQANIMGKIAGTFGRTLGPKGKMPNPKAGCVIPPKGVSIENLYAKLQTLVRVSVKSQLHFSISVGREDSKPEDVVENILSLYKTVLTALPQEKNNIKNVFIKKSMSKTIKLDM